MKNKCFSLIELLIVVAIIAILASLIQPALRKAIESAKLVTCLNNLRQINLFQNSFAEDYNDNYPIQNNLDDGQRRVPFFWDKQIFVDVMIDDYGLNFDTLICPGRYYQPFFMPDKNENWKGDYYVSYAYITGLPSTTGTFYDTTPSAAEVKVSQNTPDKIALADLNMNFYGSEWGTVNHSTHEYDRHVFMANLSEMLDTIIGSNRILIDGSGKWVTLEQMGKDGEHPDPNNQYTSRYSHYYAVRPYYW